MKKNSYGLELDIGFAWVGVTINLQFISEHFFSVIIYYLNNFFNVLGSTEKISPELAVFTPLIILSFLNFLMLNKINEK